MRFGLKIASEHNDDETRTFININNLEDLKKLQEMHGCDLIINFHELYYPNYYDGDLETTEKIPMITVYNDYIE